MICRLVAASVLLWTIACGEERPAPPPPVPVTVAVAERRDVPVELSATGTVEPLQTVSVQAQVGGTLIEVGFREGDEVRKGQVLFRIDPRPYQAELAQARAVLSRDRAQLANARATAKRYETLADKQYVTAEQFGQVSTDAAALEATAAAGEAMVEQARLNLQYATIRAPIAGRAGGLLLRVGNLVRPASNTPLVVINQIQPILVRFAVPAGRLTDIQRFRSNGILVHSEPAAGGAVSEGTLTFVDNAVDSATGTILLKARFANEANTLWPGAFVNVRLRLTVDRDALVVPATAVVSGQQGDYVFVVRPDTTVASRQVEVRRTTENLAVLADGIASGDRVVTDGQLRLQDSAKVEIKSVADEVEGATLGGRQGR